MSETTRRLLVTGWREWTDEFSVRTALSVARALLGDNTVLVQGECPYGGTDAIAKHVWTEWGLPVESHPADWDSHGKAAGPVRNELMVSLGADLCIAFLAPSSRGTRDCLRRAQDAGIPTTVISQSPERAILTDLIAELRAEHYPHPCTDPEDFPCCCESCAGAWPCLMADMADRAEERLREVTGDE